MYSGVPMKLAQLGEHRLLGQALVDGLGHTEVDDLGNGLVLLHRHQHVVGLEVAVDDRVLMRVLHAFAHLQEQFDPLGSVSAGACRSSR